MNETPMTPAPTPPDTRDAGQILNDGETLTARNISTMRIDHQGGTAALIDPVDFTIMRTAAGKYVVTLDGFEHTYTRDQRHDVGAQAPGDALDMEFRVYGSTRRDFHENVDEGHTNGHHLTIWEVTRDHEEIQGTDPQLRAFGTFGNPTTNFDHMTDMTATYTGGWVWLPIFAAEFEANNFNWDEDRGNYWTDDVAFTANFSNSTISGRIQGFREWDTEEPYDVTLTMPETSFGTEALQGNFTVSGAVREATAKYDASFWGPDANKFAGTISIQGIVDDGEPGGLPVVGIGHFEVDQDE